MLVPRSICQLPALQVYQSDVSEAHQMQLDAERDGVVKLVFLETCFDRMFSL